MQYWKSTNKTFLNVAFLNKQTKSLKNEKKCFILVQRTRSKHRKQIQTNIPIFMHQLSHQTNLTWFNFFRTIFIRGHIETIAKTWKVNQGISASTAKEQKVWNLNGTLIETLFSGRKLWMTLNFYVLMKFFLSIELKVQLSLINVVVMRSFSLQSFHHTSFYKLKKDDFA